MSEPRHFAIASLATTAIVLASCVSACGAPRPSPPVPAKVPVCESDAGSADAGDQSSPDGAIAKTEDWFLGGCGDKIEPGLEPGLGVPSAVALARDAFTAPPGGTIAYESEGAIWLTSADGKRRRRLVRRSSPATLPEHVDVTWAPGSATVAFVSSYGDRRGRIVLLDARCRWVRIIGEPLQPAALAEAQGIGYRSWGLSFSAEGRFLRHQDVSGSTEVVVEEDLVTGASRRAKCPRGCAVSPDGSKFAWADFSDKLTIAEPATTGSLPIDDGANLPVIRQLSADGLKLMVGPVWLDGKTILFGGSVEFSPLTRSTGLYRAELPKPGVAKIKPKLLAKGLLRSVMTPVISPDGTKALLAEYYAGISAASTNDATHTFVSDVSWVELSSNVRTVLGWKNKLRAEEYRLTEPSWRSDGRLAVIVIRRCPDVDCSKGVNAVAIADEQHLGLVTNGEHPAWTLVDALGP